MRYRGVKGQRKENTDGNTLFGVNLNASFAAYRTKVEETQEYGGRFWPGKWGMDSHMMLSSAASSASVTGAFGVTRLQFVVVFTGLKMTRRQLKRPFSHLAFVKSTNPDCVVLPTQIMKSCYIPN